MNQPSSPGNGFPLSRDLCPRLVKLDSLTALGQPTRKHPPEQLRKLQASIGQFGFVLPIVIDDRRRVVAGWGLVLAARELDLQEIPAITVTNLMEAQLRALHLALNRLSEDARWDYEALSIEFSEILEIDPSFNLQFSGFEMGEIDVALGGVGEDEEDDVSGLGTSTKPVTQLGDLWILGDHQILCGDARDCESYQRLLGDDKAEMIFADPPYNVPIKGHVSGLGAVSAQLWG
jgi:hypothetical protein